jgi:insulysin
VYLLVVTLLVLPNLAALEIPDKHEKDQRVYRRFVLDNGLKVLLVSDPEMNKSAASLSVGVGSLGDPKDRQGLAHFLEHMLFLGTKKFPTEGEYSKYLKSNGGYSNAYTAGDHTNYHFMIHHDALEGAIDRFSQFFIAPLFTPEFTEREIQAVHNEHQKNLKNDGWREYFLMNRFFIKDHPAHHFGTGNNETLKGVDQKELLSFYKRHYSANNMALSILSKKGLDALEDMVRTYFTDIPDHKITPISYPEKYLEKSDTFRLITMKPVKDLRSLKLIFALPALDEYFLSKPGEIMGFILGHEGKSSLLSLLKKENLALSLGAGTYAATADYASFSITVTLTEKGAKEYERVAEHCFEAIKMLKQSGYQDHIFDEMQTMNRLNQVYNPKGEGTGLAMQITPNMLRYPLEYAEKLQWALEKKDKEIYKKLLSYLTPDNCIGLLIKTGAQTDQVEPIYGTEYSYQEKQSLYDRLLKVGLNSEIRAPQLNPFLPESATPLTERPVLLRKEDGLSLWYSQDIEFKRPKASVITRFRFPNSEQTNFKIRNSNAFNRFKFRGSKVNVEFITKLNLYTALINEQLNEWAYPASQAGLNYQLTVDSENEGLYFRVAGYDSGIPKLMDQILKELKTVHLSEERFLSIKNHILRSLKNYKKEIAYHQARTLSRLVTRGTYFSPEEKIDVLEKTTYQDIQNFSEELFEQLYMESLVHGNINAEDAINLVYRMKDNLVKTHIKDTEIKKQSYLLQDKPMVRISKVLETNNDCLRKDYYLGEDSPKMRMTSQILNNFIEQPFYTEMRTRQQLGYIVWGGAAASPVDHFLIFLIQSGTHDVLEIKKRAEAFIPSLIKSFKNLSEEQFEKLKLAIEAKLKEKPKSIAQKASLFFDLIYNDNQDFDQKNLELEALKLITKQEVLRALEKALSPETAKVQELLLFSEGKTVPEEIKMSSDDLNHFRANSTYLSKGER